MTTSGFVFVSNELEVKATPGGGGESGWTNETSLDYSYLWEVTHTLANVTHDHDLWKDTNWIRKGRAFGTPGDRWTADYIKQELIDMGFENENVIKDRLKTLNPTDTSFIPGPKWYCNHKLETIDFELEINNDVEVFPWSDIMPKNETFVLPSAKLNNIGSPLSLSYTRSFNDLKLIYKDESWWEERWEDLTTDHYFNVTGFNNTGLCCITGNVTYVNTSDSLPEEDEGRVFLFPEEDGVKEHL